MCTVFIFLIEYVVLNWEDSHLINNRHIFLRAAEMWTSVYYNFSFHDCIVYHKPLSIMDHLSKKTQGFIDRTNADTQLPPVSHA